MIIFVSGPLGSGKSTVARRLKKKLPHAAIVEPDVIRSFIPDFAIHKAVPIVLEIAALTIRTLAEKGLTVIVPYPLSDKNYRFLRSRLKSKKLYFFVLSPRHEIIQHGRENRNFTQWERQRIRHHYNIGLHNPGFGVVIDNSKQKPAETAIAILKAIEAS